MNCLNCKQETQNGQVFCADCLAAMEGFPVKPDTVVQIPKQPAPKTVRRRTVSAEEIVVKLQRRLRWMVVLLLFLAAALTVVSLLLLYSLGYLQNFAVFLHR